MNTDDKTTKTLTGALLRPLAVGAKAVILHQGQVTFTSRVLSIHSYGMGEVRFETLNTQYRLLTGPFLRPAVNQFPMAA